VVFDFIRDQELRAGLEADYEELEACARAKAWKAVHVLAGSIVEAILVDYLVGTRRQTKPDPLAMSLAELISASRSAGVVSQKAAELSSAVKSYRNLIHPGRGRRLGEHADEDGALVARALVSMVVKEVGAKQQTERGPTAEQIATKFESDPTALPITPHLLREASQEELARLLVNVLPERYFAAMHEPYPTGDIRESQRKLFRAAFDVASDDVKRNVMKRYVTVLKEEPGERVRVYEEEFFRATDVDYVPEDERELIVAHLLARLRSDANPSLLAAAEGIGKYLREEDVPRFVDPLIHTVVRGDPPALASSARELLAGEALFTPEDLNPLIVNRLKVWADAWKQRGGTDVVELVTDIGLAYEIQL
jgi:hypothetical protein